MMTTVISRRRPRALLVPVLALALALALAGVAGTTGTATAAAPVVTTLLLRAEGPAPAVCGEVTLEAEVVAADGSTPSDALDLPVRFERDGQVIRWGTLTSGVSRVSVPTACGTAGAETWRAFFTDATGGYADSASSPLTVTTVRAATAVAVEAPATVPWDQGFTVRTEVTATPSPAGGRSQVQVEVDGVLERTVDLAAASGQVWSRFTGLPIGRHELTFRVLGSATVEASEPVSVVVDVVRSSGTFHLIEPWRLDDTRFENDSGRWCPWADCPPLGDGGVLSLAITRGEWQGWEWESPVFPQNTTALALNVTTTEAAGPGYVTVQPADVEVATSTTNLWPGQDVATMTFAALDGAGGLIARTSRSTHLVADAVGFWTDDTTGLFLTAVAPTRVLDTRGGAPVGWDDRVVQVTGASGVPADAWAAVVNLTSTRATGIGYVTARASGTPPVETSALNLVPGVDRSNLAIVELGLDGAILLDAPVSPTHMVVDVVGYLSPDEGSTTGPVPPERLLDTRVAEGPRRSGDLVLQVAGRAGVPADAAAVWLTVTSTQAAGVGFLTVWPDGPMPVASAANLVPGQDVAALTLARLAPDGTVRVHRSAASHVVVDLVGVVDGA